ncbi:hypothetical protein [Mesorhizobium sp.]|uniref:hypothetical protein n=1 Tax=Mesorhizobium sp. TaxID=1871066 RepID=UPI00120A53DC|nr:hypothetical protein [Mesorhizobium sp.]TIM05828.1 MAG: hypothetical protein E5Y62_26465 [Mesorhizobium sp.]
MPRVIAPIVRSTRYEHAIHTLVAKRAEFSGAIRFKGANLADQLQHIDAVLLILGYKGDPALITPFTAEAKPVSEGRALQADLEV